MAAYENSKVREGNESLEGEGNRVRDGEDVSESSLDHVSLQNQSVSNSTPEKAGELQCKHSASFGAEP